MESSGRSHRKTVAYCGLSGNRKKPQDTGVEDGCCNFRHLTRELERPVPKILSETAALNHIASMRRHGIDLVPELHRFGTPGG
jgi:hypothetical protein